MANDNRGWHGDSQGHAQAGAQSSGNTTNAAQNLTEEDRSKGGKASAAQGGMPERGRMGGNAAQDSGHAHKLTKQEQSEGGQNSHSNDE